MKHFLLLTIFVLGHPCLADKLPVTLYFESLCPDSINFIVNQLHPTYEVLSEELEVSLVPFGFATAEQDDNGVWSFTCQHGPGECYGNKVIACTVIIYQGIWQASVIDFVACAEGAENPASEEAFETCAGSISWDILNVCIDQGYGDVLLAEMGELTDQIGLTGVPTVAFNNIFNQTLQDSSLLDFKGTVCELLDNQPEPCQ